ncbi:MULTISPECIES: polysaccharide biosynthesis protein [Burkholderia]|uniref:Polysaccharide biosynthesis family protein n=1 Tax=Burkholderia cepacia TaxID=292 RepID=A0AA88Z2V1_BURCE|nr:MULTISPECIES: polysaccharide biosynthesis protein [Burkholderia]KGB93604.1 polysaccharide biosynthesis family protein [Burkholderia cepacia]KWE59576.1 polysaccharide biosynthesis protein [Burkholderia sp. MSMB2157WGS]
MLIRLLLRFSSLGLKFGLAIVVARTLGFDAVAAYGLAVAASVIASKVLGLGFSAELNRQLSARDPLPAIGTARRLCGVFAGLYLLAMLALGVAGGSAARALGVPTSLLWGMLLVALSEHAAFEANAWLFSLHRFRAGSLLLFGRTGAWAALACGGLLAGILHSIDAVFALWFASNVLVVAVCWCGVAALARRAPHAARAHRAPARRELFAVWRHGLPFYLAGVLMASLQYAERFVAGGLASADALGRYVFAWSIASAVQTIAFATVAVTAGPGFVKTLAVDPSAFGPQLRRAIAAAVGVTAMTAIAILVVHGQLFQFAHERAGAREVAVLAVLLASFALRSAGDVLWTAAIALRVGSVVTLSMAAVAAAWAPLAWLLIRYSGTTGAALAHLAASAGIVAALALIVVRGARTFAAVPPAEGLSDAA